jgi:acyl-coenzyme A thioesterase PaaI-like protein
MTEAEPIELPDDAREVWAGMGLSAPDEGNRAKKHRLTLALKHLIDRGALLEVDDPGRPIGDELDALTAQLEALGQQISTLPTLEPKGGMATAGGDDAVLAERSGFSGRSNALAPPMTISVEGEITKAFATWTAAYEGPPGCVHGGYVAAAFDDLLGCAQMASGIAGFTGTLTVRMVSPTPLFERIDYEAGVDRVEGRKIWCWGTAKAGDHLLAEATCLFISPKVGVQEHLPLLRERGEQGDDVLAKQMEASGFQAPEDGSAP